VLERNAGHQRGTERGGRLSISGPYLLFQQLEALSRAGASAIPWLVTMWTGDGLAAPMPPTLELVIHSASEGGACWGLAPTLRHPGSGWWGP